MLDLPNEKATLALENMFQVTKWAPPYEPIEFGIIRDGKSIKFFEQDSMRIDFDVIRGRKKK